MEQNNKSIHITSAAQVITPPDDTDTHTLRKLEDLNLIDNFLFHEMLIQKEVGEKFARILLETILEKPVRNVKIIPQMKIPGIDVDRHGIQLDAYIEEVVDELNGEMIDAEIIPNIYDIEPNNTYERKSLPKRMRYYHGLIDTKLLSAGAGYDKLPNVCIIFILPYDPFDKNRMVYIYTVQNRCLEDMSIPYDDGARKIFLYTKGTEGNPRQSLRDMLKYIEKSTADNITNQDIASVSELVNKVKKRKEVGINYMKSWEMEEMIRDRAIKEGMAEGREELNQVYSILIDAGRSEDVLKAVQDIEYRKQLLEEMKKSC